MLGAARPWRIAGQVTTDTAAHLEQKLAHVTAAEHSSHFSQPGTSRSKKCWSNPRTVRTHRSLEVTVDDLVGVQVVQPPGHIKCHQPPPIGPLELSSMPHPCIAQVTALKTQAEDERATGGQRDAGDVWMNRV